MSRIFFILLASLFLLPITHSAPSLANYLPLNNSLFGRGSVNFYANVTSSSINSVKLFIISEDAYANGEAWDTYTMQCTGGPEYNCTKAVSFAIVGIDTLEFFYFEANTSDGIGTLGNATHYLRFKIDRNPPVITFVKPSNASFVSGNVTVEVTATDAISGVNSSSLQLSLDNSTWTSMTNSIGYFNSSIYANNQVLAIYVKASDNLNNTGTAGINATVDNELPKITITSHSNNATIKDTTTFIINVNDSFSGVDSTKVKLKIGGTESSMTCSGTKNYTCNGSVNTQQLPDNSYIMTFTAYDVAGNSNSSNLSVIINNNKPVVILSPEGYAKGVITVSALLTNPGSIITAVSLKIEKTGYGNNLSFICNSQFTFCSYSLNTASLADGSYVLTANASNILNHTAVDTTSIVIDNTKPMITIDVPNIVSGLFTINVQVTDANHDRTNVNYAIVGSGVMSCVAQDNKLLCQAQYDVSSLNNGNYMLSVTATDLAGNSNTESKTIAVDKTGGGGSGSGGSGSVCGDNICALNETCSSCRLDCGVCGTGGSSGSSGSGSSSGAGNGNPPNQPGNNPDQNNNPGNTNPFFSDNGAISAFITSNPIIFAIIGAVLVAAGIAIKIFRKKQGKQQRQKPKKSENKNKEKPFIFGDK